MSDPACPICTKEMYSITSRRLGEIPICNECHDVLQPIMNGFALQLKEWMVRDMTHSQYSRLFHAQGLVEMLNRNGIFSPEIYNQIKHEINIA